MQITAHFAVVKLRSNYIIKQVDVERGFRRRETNTTYKTQRCFWKKKAFYPRSNRIKETKSCGKSQTKVLCSVY